MQSAENKYLTVIIPFLNEGEEIVMTVKSVRETAGDKVDIITINERLLYGWLSISGASPVLFRRLSRK